MEGKGSPIIPLAGRKALGIARPLRPKFSWREQAEAIAQKVVDVALAGDFTAARTCLDRILPIRRERRISFELPPMNHAKDVVRRWTRFLPPSRPVNSPAEAAQIANLVGWRAKAIEVDELERRITLLETKMPPSAK